MVTNMLAVFCFATVVFVTLIITRWASARASGREGLYAASGQISPAQNGLAIAGDFVSAATLLGTTAIYFAAGADSILYLVPFLLGLCLMLAWIVGPLRELGQFTLGDVYASRLNSPTLRIFSGICTVIISLLYLVAQLVGAGGLIAVLFGIPFIAAVVLVGSLMAIYVTYGGMVAATWVQVIKAGILLTAITVLALLCLLKAGSLENLYRQAEARHDLGSRLFALGGLKLSMFSSVSLVIGLSFGTMGLPHLLIRAFTVRDARASQKSVAIGATIIATVLAVLFLVISPATVAFVRGVAAFQDSAGGLRGGGNMAVIHLATAVGGDIFFGIIAAVAFATILAVVAGLTVSIASAAAHDIGAAFRNPHSSDEEHELLFFRFAAIAASIVAVALSVALQDENIAVLVAAALVIAASANFPILFLAIYWRKLTIGGALAGGIAGLTSAIILLILGPTVWVKLLGFAAPIFPSEYPTLITMPLAFIVAWVTSLMSREKHS